MKKKHQKKLLALLRMHTEKHNVLVVHTAKHCQIIGKLHERITQLEQAVASKSVSKH